MSDPTTTSEPGAYIVWTCSGNIRSYVAAQYWDTFSSREEAEQYARCHPDVMNDRIPAVEWLDGAIPDRQGSFDDDPCDPEAGGSREPVWLAAARPRADQ